MDHVKESEYSISQIVVVTNTRLSESSLACANKNKIIIRTKEELLRSLFDFEPYRKDLLKYVNSEQLSSHYIEIYGTNILGKNEKINVDDYYINQNGFEFDFFDNNEEDDEYDDLKIRERSNEIVNIKKKILLKDYVDDFLESEYKALLILGDYGSGKTSFCYIYALGLLEKFIQGKSGYLPIMIKLRGYNKAVGVAQLLTDYFVNSLGINNFNIVSLKLLLKNINVVLIFDGFDEVAKKVDFDIKYDVLKEICSLVESNTKIIVTCRPNYFQNALEFKQIFQNSHFPYEPGEKPIIEFIENSIAELDLNQINYYIESYREELKKLGVSISEILQIIANTHDLTDLAKRPFLLYMILNTLPKILEEEKSEKNTKINAYRLYLVYTDNWIKREDSKNKTLIRQEDKEFFCKELAFELYNSNSVSLSYKDFPLAIKKHFKDVERIEDIDYFTHDIQSCSFLTSDRTGDFKFIHKSFMEYFVADRVITKLSDLFEKNKKKNRLVREINIILGSTYLSMEICLFINDMIDYLGENIINAVSVFYDNVNNVAKSNLMSILAKTGINMAEFFLNHKISGDISHVDFSNTHFSGSVLRNISFEKIQFYSVRFENITFIDCNFNGTIFEKSYLREAKFYNCKFRSSEWREAHLFNCKFDSESIYDYYDINEKYKKHKKSNLLIEGLDFDYEEIMGNCDFTGSLWKESEIMDCLFNNCNFELNRMRSMTINRSKFIEVNFSGTDIIGSLNFKDNKLIEVMGEPYEF